MGLEQQEQRFPPLWGLQTLLPGAARGDPAGNPNLLLFARGRGPPPLVASSSCRAAPSSSAELATLREG